MIYWISEQVLSKVFLNNLLDIPHSCSSISTGKVDHISSSPSTSPLLSHSTLKATSAPTCVANSATNIKDMLLQNCIKNLVQCRLFFWSHPLPQLFTLIIGSVMIYLSLNHPPWPNIIQIHLSLFFCNIQTTFCTPLPVP